MQNYDKTLRALQIELIKMQHWIKETGYRLVILFEGRDTAGKGGAIQRFIEHMNPRGARVVALNKPSDSERTQWYFQRYIQHLPSAGEIVLFDRSWYNRAGVEPVMGFCTDAEYQLFLRQTPEFEHMLVTSGVHLIKFWFSISQKVQAKRLKKRETDPLKQWKLTPIDRAAQTHWEAYTQAKEIMFSHTHRTWAPWTIVQSNIKRQARINAIRHVLNEVPYDNKLQGSFLEIESNIVSLPGSPKVTAPVDFSGPMG